MPAGGVDPDRDDADAGHGDGVVVAATDQGVERHVGVGTDEPGARGKAATAVEASAISETGPRNILDAELAHELSTRRVETPAR